MKIALDVMGGDNAPDEILKGAELAIKEYPEIDEIILVGKKEIIEEKLKENNPKLRIHDAREVIEMDEHPAMAYRRKKDASITVATKLVKSGQADAVVSAGSTGAQMTAALFGLGRIKGIDRPGIGTVLPTLKGVSLLLDAGANTDCKVENLKQFALMGSIYSKNVLGVKNPRVALVNIGAEKTKGNALAVETYEELEKMKVINFVGNIEGREIPKGDMDVMVADGFVGNIILKLMEGMGSAFSNIIKEEIGKSFLSKIGALFMKGAFKGFKKRLDYSEHGGAPLLGVNGISIICHGSSNGKAIKNAIRVAKDCKKYNFVEEIKKNIMVGLDE